MIFRINLELFKMDIRLKKINKKGYTSNLKLTYAKMAMPIAQFTTVPLTHKSILLFPGFEWFLLLLTLNVGCRMLTEKSKEFSSETFIRILGGEIQYNNILW